MRPVAYFLLVGVLAGALVRAGEPADAESAAPPLVRVCLLEEGAEPVEGRLVKYEAGVWAVRVGEAERTLEDEAVASVEFLPEPEPEPEPEPRIDPEPRVDPKPENPFHELREKIRKGVEEFEKAAERYRAMDKDARRKTIQRLETESRKRIAAVHAAKPEMRDLTKAGLRRMLTDLLAAYKGDAPMRLGSQEHMKKRFGAFTEGLKTDKDREVVRETLGPMRFLLEPRRRGPRGDRRRGTWGRGGNGGPGRREGEAPR